MPLRHLLASLQRMDHLQNTLTNHEEIRRNACKDAQLRLLDIVFVEVLSALLGKPADTIHPSISAYCRESGFLATNRGDALNDKRVLAVA